MRASSPLLVAIALSLGGLVACGIGPKPEDPASGAPDDGGADGSVGPALDGGLGVDTGVGTAAEAGPSDEGGADGGAGDAAKTDASFDGAGDAADAATDAADAVAIDAPSDG